MDEYIKKSEAIEAIIEHPSKIGVFTGKAIRAIESLPAADVVPRSEANDLKNDRDYWKAETKEAREDLTESTKEAVAEIAREIFAEIEKLRFAYGFGGDIPNLVVMTQKDFEALKKKYTEEKE